MVQRRVKAVLFDWSGTLAFYTGLIDYEVLNATSNKLGIKRFSREESISFWKLNPLSRLALLRSKGFKGSLSEFYAVFDEEWEKIHEGYISRGMVKLYEDVKPTLNRLKGMNLLIGVVSNMPRKFLVKEIETTGLNGYFKAIVGYEDTGGLEKPNPTPILLACNRLATSPKETMFVGDSPLDEEAGVNAGVLTVIIDRKGEFKKNKKCYIVKSLEEIVPLLEG